MLIVRSIAFNVLFYLNLALHLAVSVPILLLPQRGVIELGKMWARTSLWLLRVVCGMRVEWRGLDKIPHGALIVAAKHQSVWETFALFILFDNPTFIIKRELRWIPFFGWCTWKAGAIPVDRGAGKAGIPAMLERARVELERGRQIIIFPEGTRRPPGAEPKYKSGVTHLYGLGAAPCLPIALNSGLYWARRQFLRRAGTVRVDILDPIPPGLGNDEFFARLQHDLEQATARLIAEGERELADKTSPA